MFNCFVYYIRVVQVSHSYYPFQKIMSTAQTARIQDVCRRGRRQRDCLTIFFMSIKTIMPAETLEFQKTGRSQQTLTAIVVKRLTTLGNRISCNSLHLSEFLATRTPQSRYAFQHSSHQIIAGYKSKPLSLNQSQLLTVLCQQGDNDYYQKIVIKLWKRK